MTAPNSAERKACWEARDLLWQCLDDSNDNTEPCQKLQGDMEAKCPSQWVKYFAKRRSFLQYKEKLESKGFTPAQGYKENS